MFISDLYFEGKQTIIGILLEMIIADIIAT